MLEDQENLHRVSRICQLAVPVLSEVLEALPRGCSITIARGAAGWEDRWIVSYEDYVQRLEGRTAADNADDAAEKAVGIICNLVVHRRAYD